MDIQRPASVAQAKKRRQIMFGIVGVLVIVAVSVVLARLKPAAPTVERATVWVDTVKRGPGSVEPFLGAPIVVGEGRQQGALGGGRVKML